MIKQQNFLIMEIDLNFGSTRFVTQKSTGKVLARCPSCRGYHETDKNGDIPSHDYLVPESDVNDPVLNLPKVTTQPQSFVMVS